MDVSDSNGPNSRNKIAKDLDLTTELPDQDEAGGEALIDQLVEFSRLPEDQVKSELDTILQQAGCESERLTLDELRAAMLSYLETFHEELEAQSDHEFAAQNGQPTEN